MLMIRLQRVGRKHEPVFRLVLTDSKNSTKSGRFLEILGAYDARRAEEAKFDDKKILHRISEGAQTSDTVHNLLLKRGIIQGEKINVLSKRSLAKKPEEPGQASTQAQPVQEQQIPENDGNNSPLTPPLQQERGEVTPDIETASATVVE